MKKIIVLLLGFVLIISAQEILTKTLQNGMEVVVKKNTSNTSVGFFCFVKTGSVHEDEYIGKGLSHYLEHIVSGGSTKNHTEEWHQNKRKEIGAITNAYTTFSATVYYMQADKQYTDSCLYLLSDNIMNCAFDPKEFEREKDVIAKEFVYRVASPMAKVYNKMRSRTYLTSNVKNEVIGEIEIFKKNTREDMMDYYNRRYMPNNMVFVAVGDIDPVEMMTKIENTFKDFDRRVLVPIYQPEEEIRPGNIKYIDEFAIQQPRAFITKLIPDADTEEFAAITMAAQILFEKRNSPVQYKLVEEEKLVNWIYGYFNDGGYFPESIIQIIFETKDASKLDHVVKRIDNIIADVAKNGITQQQINEVIAREKAQKILRTPDSDREAQNIGWNMIVYGIPDIFDIQMKQFEKLTPETVNEAIKKYFIPDNRVIFYGVPEGEKKKIEDSGKNIMKTEAEKIVISEDLSLLYKQNTTDPVIHGEIFMPVSTDYETLENAGSFQFVTDMMLSGGTKKYSSMDLSSWLEDHAVRLGSEIGPNGLYVSFKCLKDDYKELMKRLYSIIKEPVFDKEELQLAKERADADYKRNLSDPDNAYDEFRISVLYKGQRAGINAKDKNDIIQKLTKDDLINIRNKYFMTENLIVTLFGDLTKKEAVDYANELKSKIPSGNISGAKTPLIVPKLNDTFINECEFEQVNVEMNFQAPLQGDPDFFAMTALNQIMSNGFSGRLANAARIQNDLSYSTYSYYLGAKDYSFYRIISQTSLAKKDRLVEVLKNEVQRLIDGDINQEEIDISVESYAKMLDSYFTDNNLVGTMTAYESRGLGYNFLKESLKDLKKVTPEMIKTVANKYLKDAAVIISQPSADVKRIVE
ncbi:MAG: insulinase family protein [Candidatus Delongbacteria bacterium]|nr:insulinase family protein [Candidatus Delongbacteria bacterium]MCG2760809.1 insulinase family protein [Candidatus Delongbacteria bacterium]